MNIHAMQHPNFQTPDSHERVLNNPEFLVSKGHACTIDSLPVELLSRIFEFGGGSKSDEDNNQNLLQYWDSLRFYPIEAMGPIKNRRSPSFRIAVSLVCRHWYHVALSTPSLWTTLHLACWNSFERLEEMLARSKGLPLDVHFSHYIEADTPVYEDDEMERDPPLEQRYITLFVGLAPRLRRMHLSDSRLNWSRSWISSLSNLTVLELEEHNESFSPSWSQFIALLHTTVALKKLILRYAGPPRGPDDSDNESTVSDDTGDPAALVPLLNLTDLVLAEESPSFIEGLLEKVYMPALKHLSLDMSYYNHSTTIEHLAGPASIPTSVIATNAEYSLLSCLEHLRIESISWDYNIATLEMLYDGLHNLKLLQITLSDGQTTPKHLELLHLLLPYTPPGQDTVTVRLPRLETLIVCRHVGTLSLINDVTLRREEVGVPIKSLYIQRSDYHEVQRLRRNVERLSFF